MTNQKDDSENEGRSLDSIQSKENKYKNTAESKERLHRLWLIMKQKNIHSMRSLEEEEREEGVKSLFKEIKDENFPNLERSRHVGT